MLELKNISYIVEENGRSKTILNNFSYKFKDSVVTAITGHNGSGKSTLTKIIMGILKPTSGTILFNGKDITNLTIDERARLGLNYAFQQPITFKGITVKDIIDIATGENNSVSKACKYLARVGLCAKEYINRNFNDSLSGGERKRIELAVALAKKGECFVFDEPEAGVDLWSFDKLAELLKNNKTNIIVTHQEKLLKATSEIVVLRNGEIEVSGKSKDVLKVIGGNVCAALKEDKNGTR